MNISTSPYPGLVTDFQSIFLSLSCLANGESIIKENIFDNRFAHVSELQKMGAKIVISENNTKATITGITTLQGANVIAPDLRSGAALVIAGLAAKGETIISNYHYIKRGYQNLVQKLQNCGACITEI